MLKNLCFSAKTNKTIRTITKLGGIELIRHALMKHIKHVGIQHQATTVLANLANLAVHSEETRVLIVEQGGLELVLQSMEAHTSILI